MSVLDLGGLGGGRQQIVGVGGLGDTGHTGRGGVVVVRPVPGLVLGVQVCQSVSVTVIAALVAPGVVGVVHGVGGQGGQGVGGGVALTRGVGGLVSMVGGGVGGPRGLQMWRIAGGGGGGAGDLGGGGAGTGGALLEQTLQGLDVVHRLGQDVHLGHFLDRRRARNVSFEHFKSVVDSLDAAPLPGIPPGHLDVLRGRDGVAVHRVDGHQLGPRLHFRHPSHQS